MNVFYTLENPCSLFADSTLKQPDICGQVNFLNQEFITKRKIKKNRRKNSREARKFSHAVRTAKRRCLPLLRFSHSLTATETAGKSHFWMQNQNKKNL